MVAPGAQHPRRSTLAARRQRCGRTRGHSRQEHRRRQQCAGAAARGGALLSRVRDLREPGERETARGGEGAQRPPSLIRYIGACAEPLIGRGRNQREVRAMNDRRKVPIEPGEEVVSFEAIRDRSPGAPASNQDNGCAHAGGRQPKEGPRTRRARTIATERETAERLGHIKLLRQQRSFSIWSGPEGKGPPADEQDRRGATTRWGRTTVSKGPT